MNPMTPETARRRRDTFRHADVMLLRAHARHVSDSRYMLVSAMRALRCLSAARRPAMRLFMLLRVHIQRQT